MKFAALEREKADELVDLWNVELGSDFPMNTQLFVQNSFDDENVLKTGSFQVLNDEGKIIGFIVSKKWQEHLPVAMKMDTGWIQVLLIDRHYRNQGIGTALLAKAEKVFKDNGLTHISAGKDPWHYFPGIPENDRATAEWFAHKGYEEYGEEYDLLCSYDEKTEIEMPASAGVEFSILEEKEQGKLLLFLREHFPGRWEYEAMHYFKKGGTGREFVVLKKNDEILGFSRINDSRSPIIAQNVYWSSLFSEELGGIGPLGIDPAERGKGYGLAIVQGAIAHLRKRKINQIVIDWTGLVSFYDKLGYREWKSYRSFQKEI